MKKFTIKNATEVSTTTGEKSLKEKASLLENKREFDLRHIPIEFITPNPNNFYELTNIRELAENIKEFGLMQNLEVKEIELENGEKEYRLITGHRRFEAIKVLIEQGIEFKTVPCKVTRDIDDIEEKLRLIKSNSDTRELTQEEKRKQVEKLTELYQLQAELKGDKLSKSDLKETVATDVGLSSKQVERYNQINEKLIPQLQEYFDSEKISFSEAVKFARLDEQMQLAILSLLEEKDKISNEEIEIIKRENKKLIDDNKAKEQELEEKEELISNLKTEKQDLEDEKEKNLIEQGVLEEERAELEKKIREEMSQLTEEELNKNKEALKDAESKALKLEEKERELTKKLEEKERELDYTTKELEEHKNNEEKEEPTLSKEELEIAVAREKFKELRDNVLTDIIKLGELAKKYESLEVATITLDEIEKSVIVYKNKISKIK